MYFDFSALDGRSTYKLMTAVVVPRPIAWVVSRNSEGALNAAPFSFFGLMSGDPPVVTIGIGARDGAAKDTYRNLREGSEFVINLVSAPLLDQMNITAVDFDAGTDELTAAGLKTLPSTHIGVPRIENSPVAMECRVMQEVSVGSNRKLLIAEVLGMHVLDSAVLDAAKCYIDTPTLDLVARMQGGGGYSVAHQVRQVPRISLDEWRTKLAPQPTASN